MLKNASQPFTPDLGKASQICIRLKEIEKEIKMFGWLIGPRTNGIKVAAVSLPPSERINLEFGVS
jgi:hypothetical protein